VSLSTQEFKWVKVNCWGNLTNCRGVTCDGLASHPGGVEILLAASCYRNRDKLWQLSASGRQGFTYFFQQTKEKRGTAPDYLSVQFQKISIPHPPAAGIRISWRTGGSIRPKT